MHHLLNTLRLCDSIVLLSLSVNVAPISSVSRAYTPGAGAPCTGAFAGAATAAAACCHQLGPVGPISISLDAHGCTTTPIVSNLLVGWWMEFD